MKLNLKAIQSKNKQSRKIYREINTEDKLEWNKKTQNTR